VRVGLVNEKDDAAGCLAGRALQLLGGLENMIERCRDQLRHLPDSAAAAGGEADGVQRDLEILVAGDCVADVLGKFRFASAHVAGEHHQWGPTLDVFKKRARPAVMPVSPLPRAVRVDQDAQDLAEARLGLVVSMSLMKLNRHSDVAFDASAFSDRH